MSIDDIIDKAMDDAEEKISASPTEDAEVEAPEAKEEIDPVEEGEIIKQSSKKESKARDEKGKFTKAESDEPVEEPEAQDTTDQTEETLEAEPTEAEPSEDSAIDAPTFWAAEHKAIFAKLPADARQVITQYEQQRNAYVSRVVNAAEKGLTFQKRMYEDMGNDPNAVQLHRAKMQSQGIADEVQELHRYRAWNSVFESDAFTGIAELMRKNNLTPYDFLNESQGGESYQRDPAIEEARREAQAAKEAAETLRKQIESQEKQRVLMTVNAFKEGKDSAGQPRKAFAELYAPQIDQAFQEIQRQNPAIPFEHALNHAYEFVLNQVHSTLGIKPQATKSPAPVEKVASAKKAEIAAGSVKGAPTSGVAASRNRLKGKNFNEKLEAAMNEAEAQLR